MIKHIVVLLTVAILLLAGTPSAQEESTIVRKT